jgi:hypothetical protein
MHMSEVVRRLTGVDAVMHTGYSVQHEDDDFA